MADVILGPRLARAVRRAAAWQGLARLVLEKRIVFVRNVSPAGNCLLAGAPSDLELALEYALQAVPLP